MREGVKHDAEKLRMDLLPPEFLEEVSKILTHGASKYGDRNWELGMKWGRVFAALQRHLWAWWRGEELDQDSKHHHLSHAACNLAFLLAYLKRGTGIDDRPCQKRKKILKKKSRN
jgi:hypothetical protein